MTLERRVAKLEAVTPETAAERANWRKLMNEFAAMSNDELDDLIRDGLEEIVDPKWSTMTETEVDEALLAEMAGFR